MTQLAGEIAQSITGTLARFEDPSQRIFWPFLIASACIALAVCVWKRESLKQVFSREIWLHPSARMDYRLLFANAAIKSVLWGGLLVSAISVVIATDAALGYAFGSAGDLGWSTLQISLVYTVVLFVGLDLSRYLLHRLMHKVPLLWNFHQVHHSAEVLTPITVYRVHPVESFLYGMRGAVFTGLITGVFWYLFHGQASQAELLGINAIGIVLNALGANLRHSHVWLSYGRLESLLMSPAQHQMHHGVDPVQSQVNYGAFLSLWDRLAGSFQAADAPGRRPTAFGLAPSECNHQSDSVLSAYVGPIAASAKDMVQSVAPMVPRLVPRPATALLAVSAMQCTNGDGPSNGEPDATTDTFDRAGLVRNLGENVILPHYQSAVADSQALAGAIGTYCEGIDGADESTLRDSARDAWMQAMAAWQRAELSIIGPASAESLAYRDYIYSWPVISACAVDQAVMDSYESAAYDISTQLLNRRGLDALEYLLFNEDENSVCAPQIRPAGWDALSSTEKRSARCSFAEQAVADLIAQQEGLVVSWSENGGFLGNLTGAGSSDSDFASDQEAVNAIFGGLFYLELQTKDVKLGGSIGVTENPCNVVDEACEASLESSFAQVSKENIAANLEAFADLYQGGDGLGFDDFLIALGAEDKAEEMQQALTAASSALDAIDGSMLDALQNDFASAQAAFEGVRSVTDILKNDMPGLLQLDIPEAAGGDAD